MSEVSQDGVKERLQRNPMFAGLSDEALMKVIKTATGVPIAQGTRVFSIGDPSDCLYVILKGEVQIKGDKGLIATITEPGIFGEMGILTDHPRSADVDASENTVALKVDKVKLKALFQEHPEIGMQVFENFARILANHLRNNNLLLEFYFSLN